MVCGQHGEVKKEDEQSCRLTCNEVEILDPVSHELDPSTVVFQQDLIVVREVLGSGRRGSDPFL